MLKSYEVIIENNQIQWLSEQPETTSNRAIVTILEGSIPTVPRRTPPISIAGKGKTIGDLISPIVDESEWECLK